ncbi:hypothetical protein [Spiroplasma phoeniceum]|uniref:Uncharacterized protein n=1 Tax=Spiroplasma phoeniceum P40 TaxID=1276259 RepID=A0A345DN46_9MOLU|nr:hypothetical protein [Spiroplasma phoeniceum]AXF95634.1 hypothetical protein SDAV_00643 [Spiroplasma phoeniceum P40]
MILIILNLIFDNVYHFIIIWKRGYLKNAMNLNELVEHYGQWIINTFDKFDGFEYATFHYDINAHNFMQKLQEDIYPYLGYKIKMFKAKKHQTSLNKEAGIINRVTWIRKMFVQGKIYCILDNFPFLDKCISELRFSDTKQIYPIVKCIMTDIWCFVLWFLPISL